MTGKLILAIDPGTTESGWVLYRDGRISLKGVEENSIVLSRILLANVPDVLAIEMIGSYGMAVGAEVFQTCVWIGRFVQAWKSPSEALLVLRRNVKLFLCQSSRAKDANIRQALIDRIGPQGTKRDPGPTYGCNSHIWPALGVAVTVEAGEHLP